MFHFIVNPNAGSKNKAKYTKLIQLIKSNDAHSIWETTEPLEAVDFAKKALEQARLKYPHFDIFKPDFSGCFNAIQYVTNRKAHIIHLLKSCIV